MTYDQRKKIATAQRVSDLLDFLNESQVPDKDNLNDRNDYAYALTSKSAYAGDHYKNLAAFVVKGMQSWDNRKRSHEGQKTPIEKYARLGYPDAIDMLKRAIIIQYSTVGNLNIIMDFEDLLTKDEPAHDCAYIEGAPTTFNFAPDIKAHHAILAEKEKENKDNIAAAAAKLMLVEEQDLLREINEEKVKADKRDVIMARLVEKGLL